MAIHSVLIFNNAGKPRLTKFYSPSSPSTRAKILQKIFNLVSLRGDTLCNFVDLPPGFGFHASGDDDVPPPAASAGPQENGRVAAPVGTGEDEDLRVIYRHYATLWFTMVVDQSESELGILDLIQVFVEALDRCFENVCELDLIFHFDEVHTLLACMITGGLVLDTSIDSIQANFSAQMKARKSSQSTGLNLAAIQGASEQSWDRFGLGAFKARGR